MAKSQPRYVCQTCGASAARWAGRCDACGAWNAIAEEAPRPAPPGGLGRGGTNAGTAGAAIEFVGLEGRTDAAPRRPSGVAEFDRVCGGGLVPGSTVLIAGDPGIGKSTLLLQVAGALGAGTTGGGSPCAYISGEEAVEQLRLRARRLGLTGAQVRLAAATSVRDIAASLDRAEPPAAVIIDSIQTMYVDSLDSAPGTVSQVRASAQELIRLAKARGFALLLVGHVTKDGQIAGPKVLEHMVDTVLAFEGERGHQFRILRATKNRFGPTDEIGVFEMSDAGLIEVANPSALFLGERRGNVAGAAVFAGIEGTRPLLVEIQALVSSSPLATPRRAVVGWDAGRLAMVLAVLEARCGLVLAGKEVYLNVAGGLRIGEPAADLAVAAALVSAATDCAVPPETVVFGEIGLSGEIRAVSQSEARLKEAAKLGFTRALTPPVPAGRGAGRGRSRARGKGRAAGIEVQEVPRLQDLVGLFTEGQVRRLDRPPQGPVSGSGEAKA
ncbi:MAG: DNA repair protein RadA [Proteobacteria bacterium]|nr:DNA repair protein RadA [Pseudomonadota bacterium]